MKKLFAIVAMLGVFSFGSTAMAQEAEVASVEGQSIHKTLKRYFIEGSASFMSLVAIALVIGLAFCVERIIYLSLAEITPSLRRSTTSSARTMTNWSVSTRSFVTSITKPERP